MFSIELPLKTVSEINICQNWHVKKRRHDIQKKAVKYALLQNAPKIILPCAITFTRLSPRYLDDDNLAAAFKWIRDEVADYLIPGKRRGIADGDKRLTWIYKQEKSKQQGVRIEIFS